MVPPVSDSPALPAAEPWAPRELALVVPTLNERANIPVLVGKLHDVLQGIEWEVLFVDDDSKDGTAAEVRRIAQTDPRVRCIQRIGRRGLASACIEGILATSTPFVGVMDADLQHDETLLPRMLQALREEQLQIVVASRHVEGGSMGDFDKKRVAISDFATRLSRNCICDADGVGMRSRLPSATCPGKGSRSCSTSSPRRPRRRNSANSRSASAPASSAKASWMRWWCGNT